LGCKIIYPKPVLSAIYGRFLRPYNCCDIVSQKGQIHFAGFALLIFYGFLDI